MRTKNLLKKFSFLLISLLPIISAIAIQFAAIFICFFFLGLSMYFGPQTDFTLEYFYNAVAGTGFNTAIMLLYSTVTIVLLGTWYRIASSPRRMPRRRAREIIHPKMLIALLILVAAMQYFSLYLVNLIAYLKPDWYENYMDLVKSAGLNDITVLLALYTIIAAPICEELIFRGVMLHYASKGLPFWVANIIQAVAFGAFHMNFVQGSYAFLLGILLGIVFHLGKSIYLPILFHVLFNIWGTLFSYPVYQGNSNIIHLLILTASLLAVAGGLSLYKSGINTRNRFCKE